MIDRHDSHVTRLPSWAASMDASAGSSDGLEAVFAEMRASLVRRAAAMGAGADAEDVVQDVWLKIRTVRAPVANPPAYLVRMVYTALLDRRRAARRAAAREAEWVDLPNMGQDAALPADAERRLAATETLEAVEARLAALGDPAAAIFRRHRIDGVTQRRLAEEFGMGLSTIEKHLRRVYAELLDLQEDWK